VFFGTGEFIRAAQKQFAPNLVVKKYISSYGPFVLDSKYMLSDFSHRSSGADAGFDQLVETARGARCVLDVGAHVGLCSLPLSAVVDPQVGHVFAFEPSAANRKLLYRHLELNNACNVSLVPTLVGDINDASVKFYENVAASGMNTIAPISQAGQVEIHRMTTIDAFCGEHRITPDIVKMDIEGAEVLALKGAREVLKRYRPTVFLSVHPRQIAALGHSTAELRQIIDDIGYRVWDIARNEVCPGVLGFGEFRLDDG